MHVIQLWKPGQELSFGEEQRELARSVDSLLSLAEGSLVKAAVSLTMFDDTGDARQEPLEELIEGRQARDAWRNRWMDQHCSPEEGANEYLQWDADAAYRLYKWERGSWPELYEHQLRFLCAESFVAGIYMLGRAVGDLARALTVAGEEQLSARVSEARARFDAAFPDLKALRDSLAHRNERVLRRARGREIQPQDFPPFYAGGGLIGGNLWGREFHWTGESGKVAVVHIDPEGLYAACSVLQDAINALPWTGLAQEIPGFSDE